MIFKTKKLILKRSWTQSKSRSGFKSWSLSRSGSGFESRSLSQAWSGSGSESKSWSWSSSLFLFWSGSRFWSQSYRNV